ncbi:cytochrome ubiquinol oxidase subunit I [Duganella phyllosphaerae]|uniref:Cytochrome bd-I ubiquinol oxidase subunit 1 n=1 Tax=Duganella phyllosphaerae TaxID=762836 RepID=A0A1E7X8D5_9BURK|nr:cytochrome ubiquinol oxidase subunit I [Duganella phyllosphaerae]OFA09271.1 cytochrome bd-I ubiquinol oxidase subunit 1 [Duganella phyllosphaerae]
MTGFTALELARIQFGFTISFHIIFPALSIGLASYLTVLELCWLRTRRQLYRDLYHFWLKIFAVNFGIGVVSGIVLAYQFGTNWSFFSQYAGGITGPLLTYEVLTAFFLEAGFLGVMLFGWNRVGPGLHCFASAMVAIGTLISTTWILASNSFMQTPQGYRVENGVLVPDSWLEIIFNPSFPFRLMHMSVAAFLATAMVVAACGAWHLLRKNDTPAVRKMFSMAMWMLLVTAPLQAFLGDAHGINTLKHQPAKIAAIEGHWENHGADPLPLVVFAIPDMDGETNRYQVAIPRMGSWILTHTWGGQIRGLKDFPKGDRPNSTIIFFTFRVMVGLGMAMIGVALLGLWLRRRHAMYSTRWFLRLTTSMGPAGLVAILAGWYTTEIGRQPWIVYGLLRTKDAVTPHAVGTVALSLGLFIVVYAFVFGVAITYIFRLMRNGPARFLPDAATEGGPGQANTPSRPLSAAPDHINPHGSTL